MLTLESTIAFTVVFILLLGILGFFIDIALETYAAIELENNFLAAVNGVNNSSGNSGIDANVQTTNFILMKRYKSHKTFTIENSVNAALGAESTEIEIERRDYKFVYRRLLILGQYIHEAANLFGR
ncbi:hypothetical protein KHM83_09720 [Fusibacter paucivorans]|uniref:TadE-like protein n=1 Tax=Fusibacter paucivorans TaxID=76009 RepID=A0ABS5PRF1_9FIRM|nr:hypothetical protein [Fusibacter paucivorans]MBS7526956.1 hypothetical protein [Fusibacter paucivorans]